METEVAAYHVDHYCGNELQTSYILQKGLDAQSTGK
jgi:hypothetical protein